MEYILLFAVHDRVVQVVLEHHTWSVSTLWMIQTSLVNLSRHELRKFSSNFVPMSCRKYLELFSISTDLCTCLHYPAVSLKRLAKTVYQTCQLKVWQTFRLQENMESMFHNRGSWKKFSNLLWKYKHFLS